jgi:hypothetical protein
MRESPGLLCAPGTLSNTQNAVLSTQISVESCRDLLLQMALAETPTGDETRTGHESKFEPVLSATEFSDFRTLVSQSREAACRYSSRPGKTSKSALSIGGKVGCFRII